MHVRLTIVAEEVCECECVSVALGIQYAVRIRLIVDLSGSTVFFPHYLLSGMVFGKRLLNI